MQTTIIIFNKLHRGTRADMAAVASPTSVVPPSSDHHSTLMEDPDVWRPT